MDLHSDIDSILLLLLLGNIGNNKTAIRLKQLKTARFC